MRRDDNELSPLALIDLFHPNWNLSRHGFVALWLFFFCVVVFLFGFVFGVGFAFGSLFFGFCSLERDKDFGLCIGPIPVYFCGHYSFGPCVN